MKWWMGRVRWWWKSESASEAESVVEVGGNQGQKDFGSGREIIAVLTVWSPQRQQIKGNWRGEECMEGKAKKKERKGGENVGEGRGGERFFLHVLPPGSMRGEHPVSEGYGGIYYLEEEKVVGFANVLGTGGKTKRFKCVCLFSCFMDIGFILGYDCQKHC